MDGINVQIAGSTSCPSGPTGPTVRPGDVFRQGAVSPRRARGGKGGPGGGRGKRAGAARKGDVDERPAAG